jgi:hypothetical protein
MPLYDTPFCFEPASCAAVFKKPSGCLAGCGALRSEHGILHSFLKLLDIKAMTMNNPTKKKKLREIEDESKK